MRFAIFVIATCAAEAIFSRMYNTYITDSDGVSSTAYFLILSAIAVLRLEWVFRKCERNIYTTLFMCIMGITMFAGLFMMTVNGVVAIAIKSNPSLVADTILLSTYNMAYNWFGTLAVCLTIGELLTVFCDGIKNYRDSRGRKTAMAYALGGRSDMAIRGYNHSAEGIEK